MRLFRCDGCGQTLQFEDFRCPACDRAVGYLPDAMDMIPLEPDGPVWHGPGGSGPWRFCRNWEVGGATGWSPPAPTVPRPTGAPPAATTAPCPTCPTPASRRSGPGSRPPSGG